MKKVLKITGIVFVALIVLLLSAPYLFKGKINDLILKRLNESLDAQVSFADLDLSLYSSFPDARVAIEGLAIINNAPFLGDTLFYAQDLKLDMPLGDLFNKEGEPIHVNEIIVNSATSYLQVNARGNSSWDIATSQSADTINSTNASSDSGFSFDLKHYEINSSKLVYDDIQSSNYLVLDQLTHSGNGDFSLQQSTLDTYSEALVTYSLDSVNYLNEQQLKLDADLIMDLDNQKYTFKENKAYVNDLPLEMEGFVDLEEDHNIVDLSFKTPSSDFKNFLAVIPEEYRKNLDDITTTGNFIVNGMIKGRVDDTLIPKLDIKISSSNASLKYATLPQKIDNINFKAALLNETGLVDDTYFKMDNAAFTLAGDRITSRATIKQLTSNMDVEAVAAGVLNFENLANALPLPQDLKISGKMDLDVATRFDMNSIEREQYQNIKTKGTAGLTEFTYEGDALNKPLRIESAVLDFSNERIKLKNFKATTGNTDLQASGTINNLIGFLLQDQGLKGSFRVMSNVFDSADFMTQQASTRPSIKEDSTPVAVTTQSIEIPAFLDADLDFEVGKFIYDGLELQEVSGVALVRDQTMTLNNVKTSVFDGNIGVNGSLTTKSDVPRFDMALDMSQLNIAQSFKGLDLFQNLVPIISALEGTITTDLKLSGNLDPNLSPLPGSLSGNAFAQLLTRDVNLDSNPLLSTLNEKLDFINLNNLDLSEITARLKFENGAVNIQPFDFKIKDIAVTASGSHSLENEMDYTLSFNLPARYLGKEGSKLLAQLSNEEIEKVTVPLPVRLGGSMLQPRVNVNLQQAVTSLTSQIVEIQKNKIKEEGKGKLGEVLQGILGGSGTSPNGKTTDSTKIDSTKTSQGKTKDKIKEAAGNVLGGLFGKKKKKQDTTKTRDN
ncbi:MAG: AsmA-like C-terminal region-containing protein [Nonlabens sp.]